MLLPERRAADVADVLAGWATAQPASLVVLAGRVRARVTGWNETSDEDWDDVVATNPAGVRQRQ